MKMNLQLFAENDLTVTADLEPAISIDFANRLTSNITELQTLLGVTELLPMAAGNSVKIYKLAQSNTPKQVAEGEVIPLTKINRKLSQTIELTLNKFRKATTAEAIQKVGRANAINATDEKLISGIQKGIKTDFYTVLQAGTGKASGTTLQATLSACWGAVQKYYEDTDATPIYFVSSDDVAEYLGTAQINLQTAFGMSYVEDFLGLGTMIVSPSIPKGKVIATAKENLNGVYAPANGSDVAQSFNLTADQTGMIGITHSANTDTATINTLVVSCVKFFPEMIDGVIVGTIGAAAGGATSGK